MRICYVSSILTIHDDKFLKKLQEKGYEVHVVSFIDRDVEKIEGIMYHILPVKFSEESLHLSGAVRLVPNIIRSTMFLKKIIREVKPDILHGGFIQKDGLICALSGFHPFLLMPWGSDVVVLPERSSLIKMMTRYILRRADMIVCDTEYMEKAVIRIIGYPKDVEIFSHGIDLNRFKFDFDGCITLRERLGWEDKKVLIMTRLFYPIYGIEYFLESLIEVMREVSDVRVIMCGDGPLRDKFTKFVDKHSLGEYVFFTGNVPNNDLPEYYNAADIYVSSSLSDGISQSLLEAMACGLPVIVTDIPSNREWIINGENGFIVPREDSKVLSGRLLQLLQDEVLQKEFGRRNLKIAKERADWNKNFEKLVEVYEHLKL